MHKEIEKAVLRINKAIAKNRAEYNEADASYRDTGYDRYFNKMNKLDAEYQELLEFLGEDKKTEMSVSDIKELQELRRILKNVKSKWEYLRVELPASSLTVGIDNLLLDIKK